MIGIIIYFAIFIPLSIAAYNFDVRKNAQINRLKEQNGSLKLTVARLKSMVIAIEKYIPDSDIPNKRYCKSNIQEADAILKDIQDS